MIWGRKLAKIFCPAQQKEHDMASKLTFGNDQYSEFSFEYEGKQLKAVVGGVGGLTWGNFSNFFGSEDYSFKNDELWDAEKTKDNEYDDKLCWAATAANMLVYTGWADKYEGLVGDSNDEDRVFSYFIDRFQGKGAPIANAISYFFNGDFLKTSSDEGRKPYKDEGNKIGYRTDSFLVGNESIAESLGISNVTTRDIIKDIDLLQEYLKIGAIAGINLEKGSSQHAVTCCGFAYDNSYDSNDKRYITGLFIIDSDNDKNKKNAYDIEDELKYIPVVWNGEKKCYVINAKSNNGYEITDITVLRRDAENKVIVRKHISDLNVMGDTLAQLSDGSTATRTYVHSGNIFWVNKGCMATSSVVSSGAVLAAFEGATVRDGAIYGRQYVYYGASDYDTVVESGGYHDLSGYGQGITVSSGGIQVTANNFDYRDPDDAYAIISSYRVEAGASQIISLRGIAKRGIISGTQLVLDGGCTSGTSIGYGAEQSVNRGGITYSTYVNIGGSQVVLESGSAVSTTISSGGLQYIYAGGSATNTIVSGGGDMYVYSGGLASSTTVGYGDGNMHVFSNGIARSTAVYGGGVMQVYDRGIASNTVVSSGGSLCILDGGSSFYVTVSSGGWQYVAPGGCAIGGVVQSGAFHYAAHGATVRDLEVKGVQVAVENTAVYDVVVSYDGTQGVGYNGRAYRTTVMGGKLFVFAGGVATSTTISGGYMYVRPGGSATSTTISDDGYMYVSSGGSATSTTIRYGGWMFVDSGGSATSTTISDYGDMYVSSGGSATSTTISDDGGWMNVYSGGSATNTTISGGHMYVYSGGSATSTTISDWGSMHVHGNATSTTISGGYMDVRPGGSATSTTISDYGDMYVSSGGSATSTTVGYYCSMYVDGSATNTTISSGGFMGVYGTATSTTISDGYMGVWSGGSATSTTIHSGGTQYIDAGGSATNVTIYSGGSQYVESGGYVSGGIVYAGGIHTAESGALVYDLKIGGEQNVVSNGVVSGAVISSGGSQNVLAGGSAVATTVSAGGLQHVSAGGFASNSVVKTGGNMRISSGGKAIGGNVAGVQAVVTGGVASSVNLYGVQNVTGSAFNTKVLNKATQIIYANGCAQGTTVNSGGTLRVSSGGKAVAATVNAGGVQHVFNGGFASNSVVKTGGTMRISSGGKAVGGNVAGVQAVVTGGVASSINVYGQQNVTGSAYNTKVLNKATQTIYAGGCAQGTAVNSGGTLRVSSGGKAIAATVNAGGRMHVFKGGLATSGTVNNLGLQLISGGTATGVTVSAGGSQVLFSGGVASNSVVKVGGTMRISAGAKAVGGNVAGFQAVVGVASAANIYGQQNVVGTAYNTRVYNKAMQTIYAGGYAQGTTVNSGGLMAINGGGRSYKVTVNAGGSMTVLSGGLVNTVTAIGAVYLNGGATLTGTAAVTGSLNVAGVGNSVAALSVSGSGSIGFDLSGVNVSGTTYMLSTSTAQSLGGSKSISLKASQSAGVYELASGFTLGSGARFDLVIGGVSKGTLSVGSSVTIGNMSYSLSKSGTKLNLSIAKQEAMMLTSMAASKMPVAGSMLKGTSAVNMLTGTANSDVFYGGAGNDTLYGSNGRDVAVYDTKNWGKDTIKSTSGTMTILFNGLSSSDVDVEILGSEAIISRKSDSSQNIVVEGWNAETHNIVYGGTLSAFNAYVNAASPTQAQQDAARTEVWKKTGLLAG